MSTDWGKGSTKERLWMSRYLALADAMRHIDWLQLDDPKFQQWFNEAESTLDEYARSGGLRDIRQEALERTAEGALSEAIIAALKAEGLVKK